MEENHAKKAHHIKTIKRSEISSLKSEYINTLIDHSDSTLRYIRKRKEQRNK
jgi:hypothetical protein